MNVENQEGFKMKRQNLERWKYLGLITIVMMFSVACSQGFRSYEEKRVASSNSSGNLPIIVPIGGGDQAQADGERLAGALRAVTLDGGGPGGGGTRHGARARRGLTPARRPPGRHRSCRMIRELH